ncbi:MAG: TetR/AcrR family transcriptional regulator [Deltaproteobacteria bacterium]|nr:TetR/AcrR family transcriptional regulator [Deltaproteobacteria bacterium]
MSREPQDVRQRIVKAAAKLVAEGGAEAATTRAIAAAARVQAPTIYRAFGDKRGLLDAVAEHVVQGYVSRKRAHAPHADPVEDLREGWDAHVAFGLAHPGVFAIMSAEKTETISAATKAGAEVLIARVRRIAAAGRLVVSEARALALIRAVCAGVVASLLEQPESERDLGLSETAREAVIAAIATTRPVTKKPGVRGAAIALSASLGDTTLLSKGERALLDELLARLAASPKP